MEVWRRQAARCGCSESPLSTLLFQAAEAMSTTAGEHSGDMLRRQTTVRADGGVANGVNKNGSLRVS
jgi:hypothetical protein